MRLVNVGFNTILTVPESWTAFVFRGFLYVHDGFKFVVRGKHGEKPSRSDGFLS